MQRLRSAVRHLGLQAGGHEKPLTPILGSFVLIFAFGFLNGFYKEIVFGKSPAVYWALDITHFIIVPLICYWWIRQCQWRAADFRLHFPATGKEWIDTLGISIFLLIILSATYAVAVNLGYIIFQNEPPGFTFNTVRPDSGPLRVLAVLYAAIVAGMIEESVFKGLFYPLVQRYKDSRSTILLCAIASAALFGIVHWENGAAEVFGTFIYGLLGFYLFVRIRSLLPFIVQHVLIDLWHLW